MWRQLANQAIEDAGKYPEEDPLRPVGGGAQKMKNKKVLARQAYGSVKSSARLQTGGALPVQDSEVRKQMKEQLVLEIPLDEWEAIEQARRATESDTAEYTASR